MLQKARSHWSGHHPFFHRCGSPRPAPDTHATVRGQPPARYASVQHQSSHLESAAGGPLPGSIASVADVRCPQFFLAALP